ALGPKVLSYAELLAAETPTYDWPALDERAAAAMCYTSGTTVNPKGVVYSHRSTVLHSLSVCMASVFGLTQYDRVLLIVPMFHANAWGLPYAGWLTGADLLMPGRFLQPEPLCRLIAEERATVSGAELLHGGVELDLRRLDLGAVLLDLGLGGEVGLMRALDLALRGSGRRGAGHG